MGETQEQSKMVGDMDALLRKVIAQLERNADLLDRVRLGLQSMNDAGAGNSGNSSYQKALDDLLRQFARPVSVMTVIVKSNGGSYVILDEDPPFSVSRTLTKLLRWLSRHPESDGLPRYKSIDETTKELGVAKKHTLNQQIHRLRALLKKNRCNPFLVDTHNSQIRFLVREVIVRRGDSPR